MSIALRKPHMTREEFFAWAQARDTCDKFDGYEALARTKSGWRQPSPARTFSNSRRSRSIPVAELYENVDLAENELASAVAQSDRQLPG
jgi:hypothetical protein